MAGSAPLLLCAARWRYLAALLLARLNHFRCCSYGFFEAFDYTALVIPAAQTNVQRVTRRWPIFIMQNHRWLMKKR